MTALVERLLGAVDESPVTNAVASDEQHFTRLLRIVMAHSCEVVCMVVVNKEAWSLLMYALDGSC